MRTILYKFDAIRFELWVGGDYRQSFHHGLRDDKPVEWIAVVVWKKLEFNEMEWQYWEKNHASLFNMILQNEVREWNGQFQLAGR
jgi:hypothetical protein